MVLACRLNLVISTLFVSHVALDFQEKRKQSPRSSFHKRITMPTRPFTNRDKGEAVRIIGGTYAGRKGWKDKRFDETECKISVILAKGRKKNGDELPAKAVRVAKEHVLAFEVATTKEQIALEQKPVLRKKLTDLLKEFVKLDMEPSEQMLVLIGNEWLEMYKKKQARVAVDYTRIEAPPAITDDEGGDDNMG